MTRRISVLTIIDSIGVGGAESLLPIFLQHVDRDRFDIRVLALNGTCENHLHRAIRDLSIDLVEWKGRRLFSLPRIERLAGRIRHSSIDIVHTHLLYSNVQGTIAARRSGLPSIATLHNLYQPDRTTNALLKGTIEIAVLRAARTPVIAVAAEVERSYTDRRFGLDRSRVRTIPNAIDLRRIECVTALDAEDARAAVLQGADGPLIVSVGRIAPQKGYLDLVRAASKLALRYPGMRVAIAGRDAGSAAEVRTEISRLGLERSVLLLGERADVPKLMHAADIFALPSHWEGAPVVLLEAMAAGCPIVATAVGGVPEVIASGSNGDLVAAQSPDKLSAAIDALLRDPSRAARYSEAARRDVQAFGAESWARKIEHQYEEMLSSQRSRAVP